MIIILAAYFLGVCHPYHQCWGSETGWFTEPQMGYVGVVERGHSDGIGLWYLRFQRMPVSVDEYDLGMRSHLSSQDKGFLSNTVSVFLFWGGAGSQLHFLEHCHPIALIWLCQGKPVPFICSISIFLLPYWITGVSKSATMCMHICHPIVTARHGDLYMVDTSNALYLCEARPCFPLLRMGGKKVFWVCSVIL